MIAPSASSRAVTVLSYGAMKPYCMSQEPCRAQAGNGALSKILLQAVVRTPLTQKLSFTAMGTPRSLPLSAGHLSTAEAWARALSSKTVVNAFMPDVREICFKHALVTSNDEVVPLRMLFTTYRK